MDFPIFLRNKTNGDYYRYTDGGGFLSANYGKIINSFAPFETMAEKEYIEAVIKLMSAKHIEVIDQEQFEYRLKDIIFYTVNITGCKGCYLSESEIQWKKVQSKLSKL